MLERAVRETDIVREAFMLQRDGLAPWICTQWGPFKNRR
jgi:hypothetical protein